METIQTIALVLAVIVFPAIVLLRVGLNLYGEGYAHCTVVTEPAAASDTEMFIYEQLLMKEISKAGARISAPHQDNDYIERDIRMKRRIMWRLTARGQPMLKELGLIGLIRVTVTQI